LVFVAACGSPETAAQAPAPLAQAVVDERFGHAWPNDPRGTAWVTPDGGYRLYARAPGLFVAVRAPFTDIPTDVVVASTFHKVGGPPGGGYGLIVSDQNASAGDGRDQAGRYVVAAVGDRGEIGVWRRDADHWTDLLPWTASSAVRQASAPNQLSAHLTENHLTFTVNGNQVASLDTGLKPGRVGIFTGGDSNQVVVERFSVRSAQQAQTPLETPPPVARVAPPTPLRPAVAPAPPESAPNPSAIARARDLLIGIGQDVLSILQSFANGPDEPNPVTDGASLERAKAHLDSATNQADQLAVELNKIQREVPRPEH
jgi:hypothetical protein